MGKSGKRSVHLLQLQQLLSQGVSYKFVGASAGNGSTLWINHCRCFKMLGYNLKANLGNNTYSDIETPTVIDSGVLYKQLAVGQDHLCGVTTTSLIKCWEQMNMANWVIP